MERDCDKVGQIVHVQRTALSNPKTATQLANDRAGLAIRGLEEIARSAYERAQAYLDQENWSKAIPWLYIAGKNGHAGAQNKLGVIYSEGRGVQKNYGEAVKWYRLAAEQGYSIAQGNLGFMYEKGNGVPKDDEESIKWYRLEAEQEDDESKFQIGWRYATGRGAPQDDTEAVKWYRLAAEGGHIGAMLELGRLHAKARGVTLTPYEIQRSRTPGELLAFVESIWECARNDNDLRRAGHLRSGYLKKFFDEIMPLARFAAAVYPANFTVRPVLGNQGYDAEVFDTEGHLFERVEMANPVDGQARAATGRELAEHGFGGLHVGDPGDDLEELLPIIQHTAAKKAIRDYSDATVVFNISALPPFKGFEERHEEQVARIRNAIATTDFRAKRVFLMLPSGKVECINDQSPTSPDTFLQRNLNVPDH